MKDNLKVIFQIQEVLRKAGYHDISRIAREVYEYDPKAVERLSTGEPWEYIKGECEFRGNTFFVNPSTLIPRIETEKMVEIALDLLSKDSYSTVVDVGTGSGCILVSLAKELKKKDSINLIGTDISAEALKVAKVNEKRMLKERRIRWVNTNLISDINVTTGNVLVLANLPYIPTQEYLELDSSVKDFEPRGALDGGKDGIKYYRELLKQLKEKSIKGCALFEIEPSTLPLFEEITTVEIIKDLYDRDRFILLRFA